MCNCDVCTRNKNFNAAIEKYVPSVEGKEYFINVLEYILELELDLEGYKNERLANK